MKNDVVLSMLAVVFALLLLGGAFYLGMHVGYSDAMNSLESEAKNLFK